MRVRARAAARPLESELGREQPRDLFDAPIATFGWSVGDRFLA